METELEITSRFKSEDFGFVITAPVTQLRSLKGESLVPANTDASCCAMPVEERLNALKSIIKKAEISDYHILQNEGSIEIYFKSEMDANIVQAGINYKSSYLTKYYEAPKSTSMEKLKEQLRNLRTAFNNTPLKDRVTFILDEEKRTIKALTRNGGDMVDFYGQTRRMKVERIFTV